MIELAAVTEKIEYLNQEHVIYKAKETIDLNEFQQKELYGIESDILKATSIMDAIKFDLEVIQSKYEKIKVMAVERKDSNDIALLLIMMEV
mgnify:CR=1 FL=1